MNSEEIDSLSPFYLHNYYSSIKDLTFRTTFVPLLKEEILLLFNLQNARYKKIYTITEKDLELLKKFEEKLENELKKFDSKTGVFIKLNFRSPKDGFPLKRHLIPQYFEEECSKLFKKWDYNNKWPIPITKEDFEGNIKWISLYRALERLSACQSSKEIINLLLTSIRIYEDLDHFLVKKTENVYICLREFNPKINGLYEFRCFVKENQLKSITQYNHPWLVKELLDKAFCLEILGLISDYWIKNLKEKLIKNGEYVFDLALLETKEFVLIELNPVETSGRGMFKGDDAINCKEIVMKVREDLEIPYKEHWEGYVQYLMKDYCEHQDFYEFFGIK